MFGWEGRGGEVAGVLCDGVVLVLVNDRVERGVEVTQCMSSRQEPLGTRDHAGGHSSPARSPWKLEILELDVQSALHQWLCLLIAERHCLNVTYAEERAGKVCPRCGGGPGGKEKSTKEEAPSRRVPDEVDGPVLVGAILAEASTESQTGTGTWEAINKKQGRARWGSVFKPSRETWVEVLQRFHAADCLTLLEVQCEDVCAPEPKRRRSGGGAGPAGKAKTEIARPPSSETVVALVKHPGTGTKVFPKYGLKPKQEWPQNEFFNAVVEKVEYRARFRNA